MGLDMYLSAEHYLWDHEEEGKTLKQKVKELNVPGTSRFEPKSIEFRVAYWRKANAIHSWFVENCQDGVDECQRAYVGRDQLRNLVDLCKRVLENNKLAEELLSSSSGFFFGSIEYDEYYFSDIKDTIRMLEPIIDDDETWKHNDFYYQSSW